MTGKVIHQQIGHFQIQRTAAAPQRKHIGRMQIIRKRHLKYAGFVRQLPPVAIEKQHIHTLFLGIRNDGVRASGRVNIDRMPFLTVIIELIQDQFRKSDNLIGNWYNTLPKGSIAKTSATVKGAAAWVSIRIPFQL